MRMPPAPNLLSASQVCELLSIDRSTLSRWVQIGKIEVAMRLPGPRGAFLFHPADVQRRGREYDAERAQTAEASA